MKRYLAGALLLLLLAVAAPLRADEHPARPGRPSVASMAVMKRSLPSGRKKTAAKTRIIHARIFNSRLVSIVMAFRYPTAV